MSDMQIFLWPYKARLEVLHNSTRMILTVTEGNILKVKEKLLELNKPHKYPSTELRKDGAFAEFIISCTLRNWDTKWKKFCEIMDGVFGVKNEEVSLNKETIGKT
jgi:hypothetical protein